jgi:hypothetical protein
MSAKIQLKRLLAHLCRQYWQAIEIRCRLLGESLLSGWLDEPKASMAGIGWNGFAGGARTEGVEDEARIIYVVGKGVCENVDRLMAS